MSATSKASEYFRKNVELLDPEADAVMWNLNAGLAALCKEISDNAILGSVDDSTSERLASVERALRDLRSTIESR